MAQAEVKQEGDVRVVVRSEDPARAWAVFDASSELKCETTPCTVWMRPGKITLRSRDIVVTADVVDPALEGRPGDVVTIIPAGPSEGLKNAQQAFGVVTSDTKTLKVIGFSAVGLAGVFGALGVTFGALSGPSASVSIGPAPEHAR